MTKNTSLALSPLAAAIVLALPASAHAQSSTATELDTIEVSASGVDANSVNASRISVRQANLLRDVLRDMPGVYVGGTNGFNQQIYMRGVSEKGVNITIDGARQKGDVFHHVGNLLLDPELLKRVDVAVGANSVRNGSGALGGAVRFTTATAADLLHEGQNFGAKLKTSWADNNQEWQKSLMLYGRLGQQLDLLGYYNHRSYSIGSSGGDRQPVGGDGDDGNYLLKAAWHLNEANTLSISTEQIDMDGNYPYKAEFAVRPQDSKKYADYLPQVYTRATQTINYTLKPKNNPLIDLKATAYHTESEYDRTWPHKRLPKAKLAKGKGFKTRVETSGFHIDNTALFDTGSVGHALSAGYEWFETENSRTNVRYIDRSATHYPGEKGDSSSIYLEDAIAVGNTIITPGVRYDRYKASMIGGKTQTFSDLSKALSISHHLDSGLSLFASYTELFRAPDTIEAIRVSSDGYAQKNDLEPETGDNKEIGISFERDGLWERNDTLSLSAKLFRTDYENLIVQTATPGIVKLNNRYNAGEATVDGIELAARYSWQNLSFGASYSRTDSDYKNPLDAVSRGKNIHVYGDVLGREAGDKFTLHIRYALPNTALAFNWNSLFVKRYSKGKTVKPGYGVSDLAMSWTPGGKLKGLEGALGVYNLFDKNYVSHTSRLAYGSGIADYEPGRNVKLSVSWKF